jgi:O-antigen ligase
MYWLWMTALAGGLLLFDRQLPFPGRLYCLAILVALVYLAFVRLSTWMSGLVPMSATLAVLIALRFRSKSLCIFLVVGLLAFRYLPVAYEELGWAEELAISGRGRLGHYQITLMLAMRRPWFGLGMAAYRHYSWTVPHEIARVLFRGQQVSSHNNYIDIFAQMGGVGLAVFGWLVIAVGRVVRQVSRRFDGGFEAAYAYAALAGLVGMLVSGLLGDWFLPFVYNISFKGFRSSVMGWVFLGGVVALDAISRARRSSVESEPM